MGLVETEAVVLRTYSLSEADKIVVCLTRKAGLVRGVARGARRLKSRFGAGLEPFTHVNLTYFEKEGRELVTLSRVEIVRSHFQWAASSEALPVLGYLCELAVEFAPPHDTDERLFRMVRACLEAAAENPPALGSIAVYYELWMLRLAGFLPELRRCGGCGQSLRGKAVGVYASTEGVLRCASCAGAGDYALDSEAHERMCGMHAEGPAAWAEAFVRMSAAGRQKLSELSGRLLRRALEKELKGQAAKGAGAAKAESPRALGTGGL